MLKYGGEPVITIVNVSVNNMDFEASYNQSIAEKQVAQMEYEKREIENQTATTRQMQKLSRNVLQRRRKPTVRLLLLKQKQMPLLRLLTHKQRQTASWQIASQTTLIEYEKIEKWNGELPTVSGSSAIVSIEP